jgi:hypothetical protein
MDIKNRRTAGYGMIGLYIVLLIFFLLLGLVGHHQKVLVIGLPSLTVLLIFGVLLAFTTWPNNTQRP